MERIARNCDELPDWVCERIEALNLYAAVEWTESIHLSGQVCRVILSSGEVVFFLVKQERGSGSEWAP